MRSQQVLVDYDSRKPSLLATYASQVVIGAGFSYIIEDGADVLTIIYVINKFNQDVTLVDLAVYIFVRLVTRGRYAQCHSQFDDLSEFWQLV